jgi:uncharacterized membrane protein YhaH (DUF805 family)
LSQNGQNQQNEGLFSYTISKTFISGGNMESENYWLAAWNNFGVFSGRARRMEYWLYRLEIMLVGLVFAIPYSFLRETSSSEPLTESNPTLAILFLAVAVILGIIFMIVDLGVTIRRLHDTGRSGWWILIRLVPYIGGLVIFIFTLMDSEPEENQYGTNPKGKRAEIDQYLKPNSY